MPEDRPYFVKDSGIGWDKALTLSELVVHLIETKRTKTPEFEQLLKYFGIEKLEAIWKEHQEKKGDGK